jgi:hypothetical protein
MQQGDRATTDQPICLSDIAMFTPASTVRTAAPRPPEALSPLAMRVRGEYKEMPGLRLTVSQAARLFSVAPDIAHDVLHELRRASILTRSDDGAFALISDPSRRRTLRPSASETTSGVNMPTSINTDVALTGALKDASLDRLLCLQRHWTWADEAMARFDQELANGWDYDDDPMSDHPFGAYYHWCALLCAFSEAAVDRGLLPPLQLDPIRRDVEATLPDLRACRNLLVVIPDSLEAQPRVMDLLRDREKLARLRRVHEAFGEALRSERSAREIDSLDQ